MNRLQSWFREEEHPVWYRSIPEQERERMVDEDLSAGYWIPSILTAIVLCGLLSMAVSVLFAL